MSDGNHVNSISGTEGPNRAQQAQKNASKQRVADMEARQVGSQENMEEASELMSFNPRAIKQQFKELKTRQNSTKSSSNTSQTSNTKSSQNSKADSLATAFNKSNPELNKKLLLGLHQQINDSETAEEIFERINKTFADKSLADEAIDFLIETQENKKVIQKKYIEAKKNLHAKYAREIQAGRNIGVISRDFSTKGLGSPTALRDLYREVTGNPRSPNKLFEELVEKFKFSDMKNIIDFVLHSLGSDMKAKGPSIPKAELQRLFGEARTMQAILGVFRFFHSRMNLIKGQFNLQGLMLPSRINFENLSRLLMKLVDERYLSSDKILKQGYLLGIGEELLAQSIIYTQYRDAMRQISPRLFKSEKHRQETLMVIIETISDIDDELEEDEE